MHNEKLLKNFLKLVFRKDKVTPDYTFWNADDGETFPFSSPSDFSQHIEEQDYEAEEEVTISMCGDIQGMESIYGVAWSGSVPLSFHLPTLVLNKKGEEPVSIWLFEDNRRK